MGPKTALRMSSKKRNRAEYELFLERSLIGEVLKTISESTNSYPFFEVIVLKGVKSKEKSLTKEEMLSLLEESNESCVMSFY